MRVLIVTFALLCALVAGAVGQQTNMSTDEAKGKKTKSTESAASKQERPGLAVARLYRTADQCSVARPAHPPEGLG